jgi:hypothetical protein
MTATRLAVYLLLWTAAALQSSLYAQSERQVTGTLATREGKRVPDRAVLFLARTNFCPETCSCGTGKCEGGSECKNRFCYNGLIARTNKDGAFRIALPDAEYNIYADRIADQTLLQQLSVKGEPIKDLALKLPVDLVARGAGR